LADLSTYYTQDYHDMSYHAEYTSLRNIIVQK